MGFGHRVYKNYDPRAEIIKKHVDKVFEVTGKNPKLDIAMELEKRALDDEYFIERKLYPNVDFYSGLIYEALNLPPDMFTVMFAIPRTSGWIAQWLEMVTDPETKIARPRQIYTGAREQDYVPIEEREKRSEKPVARDEPDRPGAQQGALVALQPDGPAATGHVPRRVANAHDDPRPHAPALEQRASEPRPAPSSAP